MSNKLVASISQYADNIMACGRDFYGSEETSLLVDFFNPVSGEPLRWRQHVVSNFACQQNFLRILDGLALLTGQSRYRDFAREWVAGAISRLQDEESGLLYWGGHSSYDLQQKRPLLGCHEMKSVYPHYSLLYQVAPSRTQRFVEAFWQRHIRDWSTLLFNRHGEYGKADHELAGPAHWPQLFQGSSLPIVENESLSFINTGSDLIFAAALSSSLSDDPEPLVWARNLLSRYEMIRHPETLLGGYQFNHREPCRVRVSFKSPLGQDATVNETTVIHSGVVQGRYGRAALALMNLYEEIGPDRGGIFLEFVLRDLTALARHSYDFIQHAFMPVINDGRRLDPLDCIEGAGYISREKLAPLAANGLMFFAYAKAYRLSGNRELLRIALDQAAAMGWKLEFDRDDYKVDLANSKIGVPPVQLQRSWSESNQNETYGLMAWLELARRERREDLLAVAADWGETLWQRYFQHGFFFDHQVGVSEGVDPYYQISLDGWVRVDSSLPLALLSLITAVDREPVRLPLVYPNCSYFCPKIVIARQS